MQRTSRRQAAIIILLSLALLAIALFTQLGEYAKRTPSDASDYPPPSPTPYIVYSMYAINGYEGEVVAGPRVQPLSPLVLKRIQEEISRVLTAEANGSEVVYQAVIITPPPNPGTVLGGSTREPIVLETPTAQPAEKDSPVQTEQDKRWHEEMRKEILASSLVVTVSGESTAGSVVGLGEKEIQLPKDVYVAHQLISGICATAPCPKMPLTILAYLGQPEKSIAINNDGTIYDLPDKTAEQNSASRAAFQWLVDALAK